MSDVRRSAGGLGRGLEALIPPIAGDEPSRDIRLTEIRSNPSQPRQRFDASELAALTDSIAEYGVLQPILVMQVPGGYQLVAGERRVRAAQAAGLERIPAVIRSVDGQQQLALALVENLQRADLNAIDEARAFRRLADEFGLTQEAIASRVGRSRPAITNTMRLLDAAPSVQAAIEEGRISEGHGRALASLPTTTAQEALLALVEARGLSVRRTEALAREHRDQTTAQPARAKAGTDPDVERLEGGLRAALGTKVTIRPSATGGRISIEYYNAQDLVGLYERLVGSER